MASTVGLVWGHPAAIDEGEWSALACELARSGEGLDLHDGHVVAWAICRLAGLAGIHADWRQDDLMQQTDGAARETLKRAADLAQELAELLAGMQRRAASHFHAELRRRDERTRDLAQHWTPGRLALLGSVAGRAADSMHVKAGRPATMERDRWLCDGIATVVERHRVEVSQGGAFLRICTTVFAMADAPALPRDAIRSLQRERRKRQKIG